LFLDPWVLTANLFILIKWYVTNFIFPNGIVFMFNMEPVKDFIWFWNLLFFGFLIGIPLVILLFLRKSVEGLALSLFLIGFLIMIPGATFRPFMGVVIEPYWFYFSSIGVFLLVAALVQKLNAHANKYLFAILLCSVFLFFVTNARQHISLGRNSVVYYVNWVMKSPNNTIALEGLFRRMALNDENFEIPGFLVPQMVHLADWFTYGEKNRKAIMLIKRILRLKNQRTENRILRCKLAVAYYKNGNIDQSEEIVNDLIQKGINPSHLFELYYIFNKYGLKKQAVQILKQCQSMGPLYTESYLLLGFIQDNQKQSMAHRKLGHLTAGLGHYLTKDRIHGWQEAESLGMGSRQGWF